MSEDAPVPGLDLVSAGLADLALGRRTAPALLVMIGAPRLRRLGYTIPALTLEDTAEHCLYDLLSRAHGDDAHGRYNALVRRLVSCERCLELVGTQRARADAP
jgi:hypothetical protein